MLTNPSADPTPPVADISCFRVILNSNCLGNLTYLHDLSDCTHTQTFEDIRISQDVGLLVCWMHNIIFLVGNVTKCTLGTFAGDSSPFTWSSWAECLS